MLLRSTAPSTKFLNLAGELARFSGDLDRAVELKERAISVLEETGPPEGLAAALTDLAETLAARRDLDRSQETAERALEIRMRLGSPFGVAHARAAVVRLELRRGNYQRAAALSEESILVWRQEQAWGDLAWELVLAATAYRGVGDLRQARRRVREGLRIGSELGQDDATAAGLEQAAALFAESSRYDAALRLYGVASAWRESSGFVFDRDDSALELSATAVPEEQRAMLVESGSDLSLEDGVAEALELLTCPRVATAGMAATAH